jgi:glycosyltransferase involved in cell wall biosynthesis
VDKTLYFAIPGDLNTLTGGYGYDRRLLEEFRQLGRSIEHISLSRRFPAVDDAVLHDTQRLLFALPDNSTVIIDGLAFGVMDGIAVEQARRLRLIALCHHPLALEAGLDAASQARLHQSERRALQAACAVIVTSARTRDVLVRQFAVPASKITVAVPGTDRQPFAAADHDVPVLLSVATLTKRKAHDVLIAALAQLKSLRWQARFVGGAEFDPAWADHLQQLVKQHELQQRITFVGALRHLQDEFQQADVFVLPSLFEGYGMAFAEALAAGLPVVAARAGAVPDVVPETAGILVQPGDVSSLVEALRHILTDRELRQRLQQGARAAALQLPTWTNTAQQVANLIDRVQRQ